MSIELKHLRCVDAAERYGSFRKAADALSLKQSNLSRRVKYLEEELGLTLFERTSGGVRPTLAGLDFVKGSRRILDELQAVIDGAKVLGRGEAGYLTVGFYTSLSAGNLRACLVAFGRHYPQVDLSTVEDSRARLFDGIDNGTIDIAIVTGRPQSDRDCSMVLWSERIIVALPEDHALAANETIDWTDLKDERFLLSERDPGPEIQDILVAKLGSTGSIPDIVRHDVTPENIKGLVGAGRGISLLCEASTGSIHVGVVYREARDDTGLTLIEYRAHWRAGNGNPTLRNFIRILTEYCSSAAGGRRGASSQIRDRLA